MSSTDYYPMETKDNQRSYSPQRNGLKDRNPEQSEKFLPVKVEPGLDSLNKDPDDVDFNPEEDSTPPDRYQSELLPLKYFTLPLFLVYSSCLLPSSFFLSSLAPALFSSLHKRVNSTLSDCHFSHCSTLLS
ncbi:uncharacterized protein LOC111133301 isoform X1 [Crassostrea virginica]